MTDPLTPLPAGADVDPRKTTILTSETAENTCRPAPPLTPNERAERLAADCALHFSPTTAKFIRDQAATIAERDKRIAELEAALAEAGEYMAHLISHLPEDARDNGPYMRLRAALQGQAQRGEG